MTIAECGDALLLSEVRNLCGQSDGAPKGSQPSDVCPILVGLTGSGAAMSLEEDLTEGS
jgi:hypothetical protein